MGLSSTELETLRQRLGAGAEEQRVPGNKPVVLGDASCVWITLTGKLELFTVPVDNGELVGARRHLASFGPGELVLSRDHARQGRDTAILGVGDSDTRVLCAPVRVLTGLLAEPGVGDSVVSLYDRWAATLCDALGAERPPRNAMGLRCGHEYSLEEPSAVCADQGVVWIGVNGAAVAFAGHEPEADMPPYLPLTSSSWAVLPAGSIQAHATVDLLRADPHAQVFVTRFYDHAVRIAERAAVQERQKRKLGDYRALESDASALATTLRGLANVGVQSALARLDQERPVVAAFKAICEHFDHSMPHVPRRVLEGDPRQQLEALSRLARLRMRAVSLEDDWYRQSSGPLIAHLRVASNTRPVALLPNKKRGYVLYDPAAGAETPIDETTELELEPVAYQLYRALPAAPLTLTGVARFAARGTARDLLFVLGIGMLGGALGLVTPLLTGEVFDTLIPEAEKGTLVQLMLAAGAIALGGSLFELSRRFALLRMEAKLDTSLQPAVWDRLLALPLPFFRDYNAGDMAARAAGIDQIRQTLSGSTLSSILAGVFSIWNFGLLFYFDSSLALAATVLALLAGVVAATATILDLRFERRLVNVEGKLEGLLLQLLTGIAKLRVSGTERRAFGVWATLFNEKRDLEYRSGDLHNRFHVFHAVYPVVTMAVLYVLVSRPEGPSMGTGAFLAFSAAFGTFTGAVLTLVDAVLAGLTVVPLYERAKPILQATPEVDDVKQPPPELSGEIEINQVAFRYAGDGALILDDVSLTIKPGEFVALVGPSGSGKSTLLRILLGLEQPLRGGVFYDGRALASLDLREVRRQVGTVLQNAQIMEGDIFSNIVGSTGLSLQDAERAAKMAALDEDVAQMPMGMHTLLNQGGGTLSGGQRQRLLIARALVNAPRLLFFDEATSALDNRTQALVSRSLENLNVTRVVVAHRLSTIENADTIYVLERGRIVESGSYAELMARQGAFHALARRQLV